MGFESAVSNYCLSNNIKETDLLLHKHLHAPYKPMLCCFCKFVRLCICIIQLTDRQMFCRSITQPCPPEGDASFSNLKGTFTPGEQTPLLLKWDSLPLIYAHRHVSTKFLEHQTLVQIVFSPFPPFMSLFSLFRSALNQFYNLEMICFLFKMMHSYSNSSSKLLKYTDKFVWKYS